MKIRNWIAIPIVLLLPIAAGFLSSAPASAQATADFDAATAYKDAKCGMCHKTTAEKYFDPAKADGDLVQAILKGVKGEGHPPMPAYEAKGFTEDQAKALVAYMRTLRQAP